MFFGLLVCLLGVLEGLCFEQEKNRHAEWRMRIHADMVLLQ